jgi:hypothetical protein
MAENALQFGVPESAGGLVGPGELTLATELTKALRNVLASTRADELLQFPELVGRTPKESVEGVDPHVSLEDGWDPKRKIGLRLPNPVYPKRLSPVIAFQTTGIYGNAQPIAAGRLVGLFEIADTLGQQIVAKASEDERLQPYLGSICTYETRINANLNPSSPLFPVYPPEKFLHAPHTDKSVATVGVVASGKGFVYSTDKGRTYSDFEGSSVFLGDANGMGHLSCLHAVLDESGEAASGSANPQDGLLKGVSRMAVVVFLQGPDFAKRTSLLGVAEN